MVDGRARQDLDSDYKLFNDLHKEAASYMSLRTWVIYLSLLNYSLFYIFYIQISCQIEDVPEFSPILHSLSTSLMVFVGTR